MIAPMELSSLKVITKMAKKMALGNIGIKWVEKDGSALMVDLIGLVKTAAIVPQRLKECTKME
jgi:hypothetical protein